MRGFHFMASDIQMREVTQIKYMSFAGLRASNFILNQHKLMLHLSRHSNHRFFNSDPLIYTLYIYDIYTLIYTLHILDML